MMPRPIRPRPGYALLWVLVLIAILTALGAAVAPSLLTSNDYDRVSRTAATLKTISDGVRNFNTVVKRNGGTRQAPGFYSQLTGLIANGDPTSCHVAGQQTMNAADVTSWVANAPFVPFLFPTDGLETPLGHIRDSVPDRTADKTTSGYFWVEIPGASGQDAYLLDQFVDGTGNAGAGTADTVQYNAPIGDTTTIRYRITPTFSAC